MSNYALAVDIGGTFTDVVVRSAAGRAWVDKSLTTPDNLDTGLFRAIDVILGKAEIEASFDLDAHLRYVDTIFARVFGKA